MKSIELLAPAKDLQAAVAAVDYGADALYIGGARFGARHAAGNSAEEIARAVEYAHQYGVRVHATLNTLLYDGELAEAERQARELIAAGVDALIVQDMALRRMNLPVELHASTQAATRTPEQALFLERCGFEAEDFGGGDVLIRQIPSDVDVEDAKALLQELAGDLLAGKTLDPDSLRDNLLHTIACKSAIKAGWQTSDEELRRLVQEVLSRDDIKYCPHGRPVCVTLTKRQLEKQFKRV